MRAINLIDALSEVSNVDLFKLSTVIQLMLDDPRRIMATRINMYLGQTVRFVDYRDGRMRSGHVVTMKDTQATPATPPTAKPKRDDLQRGDCVGYPTGHTRCRAVGRLSMAA